MNDLISAFGGGLQGKALIDRASDAIRAMPDQLRPCTTHAIHAGVYCRTVTLPAHCVMTNVIIKIPTLVIISGDIEISNGCFSNRYTGQQIVIPADAPRQSLFHAIAETSISMIFATDKKTVAECEAEFTDMADELLSRESDNVLLEEAEL